MEQIRKEIIYYVNKDIDFEPRQYFNEMVASFNIDYLNTHTHHSIEDFFVNCMKSVFYRPNELNLLIFDKEDNIDDIANAIDEIMGRKDFVSRTYRDIYSNLIINFSDCPSAVKPHSKTDGFKINYNYHVDKRLSSAIAATWYISEDMKKRKKNIIVKSNGFDYDRFMRIDKEKLWIDIFHMFLNRYGLYGTIPQDEIDSFFCVN